MQKRKKAASDEGSSSPKKQKRASVPHARGGTHRVKEEHKTNTKWDHFNRAQLEAELKTRRGLYKKDLKKHVIARLLADDDTRQRREGKQREKEAKKKAEEAAREKKAREERSKERARKEFEKRQERRREQGLDKEEDERPRGDEGPVDLGTLGKLVEEFTEESTTETTTTTASSLASPLMPTNRLRIVEWPAADLPSPNPPDDRWWEAGKTEIEPPTIPYAVMNLVTTVTAETVELPGRTYPEKVGGDFVPQLEPFTINCARNGIMIRTLRRAVIESGLDWSERTLVQGYNGRMYFHLAPATSSVPLKEIERKWDRIATKQPKGGKGRSPRNDYYVESSSDEDYDYEYGYGRRRRKKKKRPKQRHLTIKEKRLRMLDFYAAATYRPPIGYDPLHLDFPSQHDDSEGGPRELDNLYFVRFPGCDLPHYYFWANPNEWEDPLTSNPEWLAAKLQDEEDERLELLEREVALEKERRALYVRPEKEVDPKRPYPLHPNKTHAKLPASALPPEILEPPLRAPGTSPYEAALDKIERSLVADGLAKTLAKHREMWLDGGKVAHWSLLTKNLPRVYPSGTLPGAPPVLKLQKVPAIRSVSEKMAAIQVPHETRPVSPIRGDEAWTREDERYWQVTDIGPEEKKRRRSSEVSEADIQQQLLRGSRASTDLGYGGRRRSSGSYIGKRKPTELDTWLDTIEDAKSQADSPRSTRSGSSPGIWVPPPKYTREKWQRGATRSRSHEWRHWENAFLGAVKRDDKRIAELNENPRYRRKHHRHNGFMVTPAPRVSLKDVVPQYESPPTSEEEKEGGEEEEEQWEQVYSSGDEGPKHHQQEDEEEVPEGFWKPTDSWYDPALDASLFPKHLVRIPVAQLRHHIENVLDHPDLAYERYCRLCFLYLDWSTQNRTPRWHYQWHLQQTEEYCPFCGMEWMNLDDEWRAAHILLHDWDAPKPSKTGRRRSSGRPPVYYSVPRMASRSGPARRRSSDGYGDGGQGGRPRRKSSSASSSSSGRRNSRDKIIVVRTLPEDHYQSETHSGRTRRGSKVHFSPSIVERRIPYNDEEQGEGGEGYDDGMDADASEVATSPRSPKSSWSAGRGIQPRKSSLKSSSSRRSSSTPSIPPARKPSPSKSPSTKAASRTTRRASTSKSPSTKVASPRQEPESSKPTLRRFTRQQRKGTPPSLQPYEPPSSASSHVPSPYLPHVHRYPPDHPNARFNPRRYSSSGESHDRSPYLPQVKRYPPDHPDAAFDPKNRTPSTEESLEYYTGPRGKRTGKGKGKGKGNAKADAPRDPGKVTKTRGRAKKDVAADPSKRKTSLRRSVASSTGLVEEFDDLPDSPASSTRRRSKSSSTGMSGPLDRLRISSLSSHGDSATSLKGLETGNKVKGKAKEKGKGKQKRSDAAPNVTLAINRIIAELPIAPELTAHRDSTVSNASFGPSDEQEEAQESYEESSSSSRPRRKRSSASSSSERSAKRRRVSRDDPSGRDALHRRVSSVAEGKDFLAFVDDDRAKLFEDRVSDVLQGNPFAAPSKKGAATQKDKRKGKAKGSAAAKKGGVTKAQSKSKAKSTSSASKKASARGKRNLAATMEQVSESEIEIPTPRKTTLSGRPFVEPLIIAPARRMGKRSPKYAVSIPAATTAEILPTPERGPAPPPAPKPKGKGKTKAKSKAKTKPAAPAPPTGRVTRSQSDAKPIAPSEVTKKTSSKILSSRPLKSPVPTPSSSPRRRRSSAPTPSPSISQHSRDKQRREQQNQQKAAAAREPDVIVCKRPSYDVPFSDTRPIVPPNTPAIGLLAAASPANRRHSRRKSGAVVDRRGSVPVVPVGLGTTAVAVTNPKDGRAKRSSMAKTMDVDAVSKVLGTGIDAGALQEKIGRVKVTRAGLVREVPVLGSVVGSGGKGKKEKGVKKNKVVSGRVEKKGKGKSKTVVVVEKEAEERVANEKRKTRARTESTASSAKGPTKPKEGEKTAAKKGKGKARAKEIAQEEIETVGTTEAITCGTRARSGSAASKAQKKRGKGKNAEEDTPKPKASTETAKTKNQGRKASTASTPKTPSKMEKAAKTAPKAPAKAKSKSEDAPAKAFDTKGKEKAKPVGADKKSAEANGVTTRSRAKAAGDDFLGDNFYRDLLFPNDLLKSFM